MASRERVLARDGYACRYCLDSTDEVHIDHVFPRSKGGTSHIDNLAVACPTCNLMKRDLYPWVHPETGISTDDVLAANGATLSVAVVVTKPRKEPKRYPPFDGFSLPVPVSIPQDFFRDTLPRFTTLPGLKVALAAIRRMEDWTIGDEEFVCADMQAETGLSPAAAADGIDECVSLGFVEEVRLRRGDLVEQAYRLVVRCSEPSS